jgi:hypothetical protein
MHSRLEPFKRLARTLKMHFEGVIGHAAGGQQRICGGHQWVDAKRQARHTRVQKEEELHRDCVLASVQA